MKNRLWTSTLENGKALRGHVDIPHLATRHLARRRPSFDSALPNLLDVPLLVLGPHSFRVYPGRTASRRARHDDQRAAQGGCDRIQDSLSRFLSRYDTYLRRIAKRQ